MTLDISQGYELWRGPSPVNGAEIVAIATGFLNPSANPKTGEMIQVWILATAGPPQEIANSGADSAICGSCPLRRGIGGGCYVTLYQAPRAVYNQCTAGRYPELPAREAGILLSGRKVRLGAYGDPAMVPAGIWRYLLAHANGWTGYTHQWREPWAQEHREFLMASVDPMMGPTEWVAAGARRMGWRTFRVLRKGESKGPGEFTCPASAEAGFRRTCATCLACDGGAPPKASVTIQVHGSLARRF